METVLAACVPLLLLAGLFGGLKHPLYALHLLITGLFCLLAQVYLHIPAQIFAQRTALTALSAHLVSINCVTALAYWYDKQASINGSWRIPERTLNAFALIGGTPAAWGAQMLLRHKIRKRSFQIVFWAIFILQVLAIAAISLSSLS